MDYGWDYPFKDFSDVMGKIGSNVGAGVKQRRLGSALSGLGPDASWQDRAQAIMSIDPAMGAQMLKYGDVYELGKERNSIDAAGLLARSGPKAAPSATAMRARHTAEDDRDSLKTAVANLEEAQAILDKGVYSGGAAGVATELGTNWNYGGIMDSPAAKAIGIDTEKAKNTAAYLRILGPEAMQMMAQQLKGSTAYQELLHYMKLYADPTTPDDIKAAQLRRLTDATKRHLATKEGRINELTGASDAGGDAGGEPQIDEERDSPQGRVRYIGNDQWELIE
jgi:hypothetical protein